MKCHNSYGINKSASSDHYLDPAQSPETLAFATQDFRDMSLSQKFSLCSCCEALCDMYVCTTLCSAVTSRRLLCCLSCEYRKKNYFALLEMYSSTCSLMLL
jgi:hypothetical protein